MALKLDLILNALQFKREAAASGKSVDDISDSLDDLARNGDRDAGKLEASFRDLARQAQKTDRQVSSIGEGGSGSLGKLGEKGKEVSGELRQNLGETFASFKGDLADLPQIAQDTLGGLAGSGALGGIAGLAITAAGAAGLGLITAAIQQQQADAQLLKDRLSSAYQGAVEDGKAYLDTAAQIANAHDLMFNTDRASEWQKVQDTQKQTGLDMSTILQANAGDAAALAVVIQAVKKANHDAAASGKEVNLVEGFFGDNLQHLNDYWQTLGETSKTAQGKAKDALQFTSDLLVQQIKDAGSATEAVDKFGNALYTLPSGQQVVISAATGQATTDLSQFKADVNSVPKHTVTTVELVPDRRALDRTLAILRNSKVQINAGIAVTLPGGKRIL